MSQVHALSLAVFANLFSSVADGMGVVLQRAAYSPNITMRRDFSCAIFDSDANLLAQAAHIPVHLGAMPMAMRAVRERFDLGPGDVAILNDPFAGGTHLPDISLVSTATVNGERLGYVMSRAHHADVGGMSAGSMPLSTEIFAEGMIIPPLLLYRNHVLNEPLLELLLRNVRTPDERRGDLRAQLAAQRSGEEDLAALAARYGSDSLRLHGEALQAYAESAMRAVIRSIPPGEYCFEDYLDDDGQGSSRIPIRVAARRVADADDLVLDFSGSAAQVVGSLNAVRAVTISAALYVPRCLQQDDVPVNEGSLRPLRVIAPAGSVVAAESPAAVAGGNVETSQRIVDVLFGALAMALPDLVPAASQGTMNNVAFGGYDRRRARSYAYYETMGGGMGARPAANGMDGVHDHMSNTLNTPVELLETEYPVRVERYALRPGSGGDGHWKGGDGIERALHFLDDATVTLLTERRHGHPYGLQHGEPGASGENSLVREGNSTVLPAKVTIRVGDGDVVSVASPGGGGWGKLSSQ